MYLLSIKAYTNILSSDFYIAVYNSNLSLQNNLVLNWKAEKINSSGVPNTLVLKCFSNKSQKWWQTVYGLNEQLL